MAWILCLTLALRGPMPPSRQVSLPNARSRFALRCVLTSSATVLRRRRRAKLPKTRTCPPEAKSMKPRATNEVNPWLLVAAALSRRGSPLPGWSFAALRLNRAPFSVPRGVQVILSIPGDRSEVNVKWLTTLVLLETDGSFRQHHLLPLDLENPAQRNLLKQYLLELLEVGLSNINRLDHEIRIKLWTRALSAETSAAEEPSKPLRSAPKRRRRRSLTATP